MRIKRKLELHRINKNQCGQAHHGVQLLLNGADLQQTSGGSGALVLEVVIVTIILLLIIIIIIVIIMGQGTVLMPGIQTQKRHQ